MVQAATRKNVAGSEEAGDFGVSAVTRSHWRREGLLGPAKAVPNGGRGGFRSESAADTAERYKRILELREGTRAIDRIRFLLWCEGFDVDEAWARADLIHFLESAAESKPETRATMPAELSQLTAAALTWAMRYQQERNFDQRPATVQDIINDVDAVAVSQPGLLHAVRDQFRAVNNDVENATLLTRFLLWTMGKKREDLVKAGANHCELKAALLAMLLENQMTSKNPKILWDQVLLALDGAVQESRNPTGATQPS